MSIISEILKLKGVAQKLTITALVIMIIGFGVGRWTAGKSGNSNKVASGNTGGAKVKTVWTCSMHPQIRQPEPGKCPICGMTLIPAASSGGDDLGPRMMSMSEASLKLAEVKTAPVQKHYLYMEIPMVGLINYDETRVKTIAAWMPGRLDRLFVDYTGVAGNKGDHMVGIYSPDLFAAQVELL